VLVSASEHQAEASAGIASNPQKSLTGWGVKALKMHNLRGLKDWALEATFCEFSGAPTIIGATKAKIPQDKNIKAIATFKNEGVSPVTGLFLVGVVYGDELSDPVSDDPLTNWHTWFYESDAYDFGDSNYDITLNPGSSGTVETDGNVPASTWAEETTLDAGIILYANIHGEQHFLDSLKIDDAIEIIAPATGRR